jgi:cytidylate kinase
MVVTLDGPAGAGKSTVAKALARRLGFEFLNTGAMYRAVALAALRRAADWYNDEELVEIASQVSIELDGDHVVLNGEDVSREIRQPIVASVIHFVADNPAIRKRLVELQRRAAQGKNIVAEGRDQGTVAFPNADCKFFVTATPEERARRRVVELQARGESANYDEILSQQNERDRRDATRPVGKLVKADDAIEILTDNLTQDQVVDRLEELARKKLELPAL